MAPKKPYETLNKSHLFKPEPRTQIQQLLFELGVAAGNWRDTKDAAYITEYHEIYRQLLDLGFKGAIDFSEQLPVEYMPEDYVKRFNLK